MAVLARPGEFHIRDYLAAERLVTVLQDAVMDSEPAQALIWAATGCPRRVQAYLGFTTPHLRAVLAQAGDAAS
jgi:hypothetical protein